MKILHCGDWHIGSFSGPEKNGENLRFQDGCHSLQQLVLRAKQIQPDGIVVAGDVFHQAKVWSDRGLRENQVVANLLRQLGELAPTFVLRGTPNHDSKAQFNLLEQTFQSNANITIITKPCVKSLTLPDMTVCLAFLPGFDPSLFGACSTTAVLSEEQGNLFSKALQDTLLSLRQQCKDADKAVLISHYTIVGANTESGQAAFFGSSEPVITPKLLRQAAFDLSMFGHIHRPQQVANCPHTFYCGAIARLNFHDEGQERGFYLHELTSSEVSSTFFPLPSRSFTTLTLSEEQINTFLRQGTLLFSQEQEQAIAQANVRVRYPDTQNQSRFLPKGALEKLLREKGAFWVHEILPLLPNTNQTKFLFQTEKYSSNPEEEIQTNLRQFLEQNGMNEEQRKTILSLAKPLTEAVVQTKQTGAQSGRFTPISISVKNYRNYQEETVSFEDIRFCLIHGKNGVGKSSLFMDALLDALFEQPREGDLTGWIRNDPSVHSGMIAFVFQIGETRFQVIRTRQKKGKASLTFLEQVNGEWQSRSKDKLRDTQEEIIRTIGMDARTLTSTGLILQDQYGVFLEAGKEERMEILGTILGLSVYSDLEEMVIAEQAALTNLRKTKQEQWEQTKRLADTFPSQRAASQQIHQQLESLQQEKATKEKRLMALNEAYTRQKTIVTQLQEQAQLIQEMGKHLQAQQEEVRKQKQQKADSEAILAREAEIQTGVSYYHGLLAQEHSFASIRSSLAQLKASEQARKQELNRIHQKGVSAKNRRIQIRERMKTLQKLLQEKPKLEQEKEEIERAEAEAILLQEKGMRWMEQEKQLQTWNEQNVQLQLSLEHDTAQWNQHKQQLQRQIALLEQSGCFDLTQANCRFLQEAKRAQEELPQCQTHFDERKTKIQIQQKQLEEKIEEASQAVSRIGYDPKRWEQLQNKIRSKQDWLTKWQAAAQAQTEWNLLVSQKQEVDAELQTLAEDYKRAQEEWEETQKNVSRLQQETAAYHELLQKIEQAKNWLEQEKQLARAKERWEGTTNRLLQLEEEIKQETKRLQEKERARQQLQAQIDFMDVRKEKEECEQEIHTLQEQLQTQLVQFGRVQKQMEQAEIALEQLHEWQVQLEEWQKRFTCYETLKLAFSKKGIPHKIICEKLPFLEQTANTILMQMSGGSMQVSFVTEKKQKTNKKEVATLDVMIQDENGTLPYLSKSGGERVKASLAIILAIFLFLFPIVWKVASCEAAAEERILIVLDAGHQANTNRGVIQGYYEGNQMYQLTLYEKAALEAYGFDVILTRTETTSPSLISRGETAVQCARGYDRVVFMSDHSNAAEAAESGIVACTSKYLSNENLHLIQSIMDAAATEMNRVTGVTYNRHEILTRDYTEVDAALDWYGVIRGSVQEARSCAEAQSGPVQYSFILEHGFHTNRLECAYLMSRTNLQNLAQAKAKAFADYFGKTNHHTASSQTFPDGVVVKVADNDTLNVRLFANPFANNVLETLENGTRLHILGQTTSADGQPWYQIQTPSGTVGYVNSHYISLKE